jgi:hypothetical protein
MKSFPLYLGLVIEYSDRADEALIELIRAEGCFSRAANSRTFQRKPRPSATWSSLLKAKGK